MSDEDRADRISRRRRDRDESQADDTSQTDENSQASNTDNSSDVDDSGDGIQSSDSDNSDVMTDDSGGTESSGVSVRDQTHVAMYLPDDLAGDLDLRFDELNLEYRQEHGEKMTKNGEFYPALARAAINDTTLREELGLGEVNQQD